VGNRYSSDSYHPAYKSVGQAESLEFPIKEELRYLVNPGSVGQPRDGDWRAAFAVYDSEARTVTFCRVPYNLKQAQERILEANLPQRLATRLAAGR
jgi:diadenosine tetraphosphatase ApaH/serine/threonine PP2A family protein phosphatase